MLLLFSFACFFSSQHNSNRYCEFHTNSSAMRVRYILLSTNYAVINNWKIWSQLIRETQKVDFQSSAFETMLSEKWSKEKKLKTFSMLLVYGQPKNNIFKHLNIDVIFNFCIYYILVKLIPIALRLIVLFDHTSKGNLHYKSLTSVPLYSRHILPPPNVSRSGRE